MLLPLRQSVLPEADRIVPYLERIDRSLWYSNRGPLLLELESRLATHFGRSADEVTVLSNGTVALVLPLLALDLPPGAKVLVPSFTFAASAVAVIDAGLTPVFVDVDPTTWTLTPRSIEAALESVPDAAAVMPVTVFGAPMPADWDAFTAKHGIPVLIDAAWSFDTAPRTTDTMVGLSLHATKVLGAGEGGVVLAPAAQTERIRQLANFGFDADRQVVQVGRNGKLSEYGAAVGLASLDAWPAQRPHLIELGRAYASQLTEAGIQPFPGFDGTWATATVAVDLGESIAEDVRGRLAAHQIESRRWWGSLAHRMPAFTETARLPLPVSERLADCELNLPMSPRMSVDDVTRVVTTLKEVL